MGQPRIQRMRQAPGARGVGFFGVLLAAGGIQARFSGGCRQSLRALGSGCRHRFVPAAWLQPLVAMGLALETMDTAAACRTYNVLAHEGRRVVAALVLEAPAA